MGNNKFLKGKELKKAKNYLAKVKGKWKAREVNEQGSQFAPSIANRSTLVLKVRGFTFQVHMT